MRRRIGIAMAAALALSQVPAGAQTACGARGEMVAGLASQFGERQVSLALDARGRLIETFANGGTGTWSVLATRPGGPSCLILFGQDFRATPEEAAPDDAPGQRS